MSSEPEQPGGPPARHLREQLEHELGKVPPESPTEPPEGTGDESDAGEADDSEADERDAK